MSPPPAAYAIKAAIHDLHAACYVFPEQKTMYCGKKIAEGDPIFLLASENDGGSGLFARGVVTGREGVPLRPDLDRQTIRVSITVKRTGTATRRLGRTELRAFTNWTDEAPETELNFKLYRQATDKVVGLTGKTAEFLSGFF